MNLGVEKKIVEVSLGLSKAKQILINKVLLGNGNEEFFSDIF